VMVHATQARGTIDRRARAARLPLLVYLACVAALLGAFAAIIYGLMQPTVIPNVGMIGYQAFEPTNLFLHKPYKPGSSVEEMERAAIEAAETENKDQGIEPLTAFAAVEPAASKPARPQANAATVRRAKRANPKSTRVARQNIVADPWRSSWSTPWSENERPWTRGRPLWASRDRF
jgi:hypothetical protein